MVSAFGANLDLGDSALIDRAGLAESVLPPGGDDLSDLITLPVGTLVETGAARGQATTSAADVLPSLLDEQQQPRDPGPYNARGIGQVDDLGLLLEVPTGVPNVNLELATISADSIRAEAVGVCRNGRAVYSGQSEFVNAEINNEPLGLDTPLTDLLETINTLLEPLQAVVDIDRNQVQITDQGVIVNALRVTVLDAIPDPESPGGLIPNLEQPNALLDLTIGQAQIGGLQCPPADRPECSDTQDNDGDGRIDANDPGCINNGVYDPLDDDERDLPRTTDTGGELPRTGGDSSTTLPMAGGFAVLALGALALRRRSHSSS